MLLREIVAVSSENQTEQWLWGQGAEILMSKRVTTVLECYEVTDASKQHRV